MFTNNAVFQILGDHRGTLVLAEVFKGRKPRTQAEVEKLLEIGRLYIDAAHSLVPRFSCPAIDAGYAKNNLSYLLAEYFESRQLYRVFVPFFPAEGGTSIITEAKEVALMRAILDPPAEPEFPINGEVQLLLNSAETSLVEGLKKPQSESCEIEVEVGELPLVRVSVDKEAL